MRSNLRNGIIQRLHEEWCQFIDVLVEDLVGRNEISQDEEGHLELETVEMTEAVNDELPFERVSLHRSSIAASDRARRDEI